MLFNYFKNKSSSDYIEKIKWKKITYSEIEISKWPEHCVYTYHNKDEDNSLKYQNYSGLVCLLVL